MLKEDKKDWVFRGLIVALVGLILFGYLALTRTILFREKVYFVTGMVTLESFKYEEIEGHSITMSSNEIVEQQVYVRSKNKDTYKIVVVKKEADGDKTKDVYYFPVESVIINKSYGGNKYKIKRY